MVTRTPNIADMKYGMDEEENRVIQHCIIKRIYEMCPKKYIENAMLFRLLTFKNVWDIL